MSAISLYEIMFDPAVPDQWYLGAGVDAAGRELDDYLLSEGREVEVTGGLVVPIVEPGRPLEFNFASAYGILVTKRVAELLGELVPYDLQRIPARVESMQGCYELLNLLSTIDCLDRERTLAEVLVKGDPEPVKKGTLASLAPLLDHNPSLHAGVMPSDVRLDASGIDGPRLFRVEGRVTWPILTQEVKTALEEAGVTGLRYRLTS